MTRTLALTFALIGVVAAGSAFAQDARPGPGRVDVSLFPAGGTFFTEAERVAEPAFGNYELGASVTFNANRFIGVEAEVGGALGIQQELTFDGMTADVDPPDVVNYTGNLIVSIPNRSPVVPYVTAGAGGLSLLDRSGLGIQDTETFLTGNVGGCVKWYAGRWGLRGDYRFVAVRSNDEAPEFFGRETRYGHRVYGGVILSVAR